MLMGNSREKGEVKEEGNLLPPHTLFSLEAGWKQCQELCSSEVTGITSLSGHRSPLVPHQALALSSIPYAQVSRSHSVLKSESHGSF